MTVRLSRIEKSLGTNGHDGIFARRDEVRVIREAQAEVHKRMEDNLTQLKTDHAELVVAVARVETRIEGD
jgi:hypothetical protein